MLVNEEVLNEEVLIAQVAGQRMAVHTVERVPKPFVVIEQFAGIIDIGHPLGAHLPEGILCGFVPVVHPSVPVVVVAVDLVLEAVPYLVGYCLSAARSVSPAREREHTDLVVDAAAFGLPFASGEEADDHLVGVALGLALVDGDEAEFVSIHLEDLVGRIQDARYGTWHFVAVFLLPEEHPVLRLVGALVAPLVIVVLQLRVRTAGAAAAIDFLIDRFDAVVQGVDGGLQLVVRQRIVHD